MQNTSEFAVLVLAVTLAFTPLFAGTKASNEPPLVGTVVFRTPANTEKLDINTASKRQLSSLPGMAVYADKIIAGRPYSSKLDLVKRGIVPQGIYDKLKDRIIAHRVHAAKPKIATSGKNRN